jgi:localization factor PodJL
MLAARYEKGDGLQRDSLKACVWYIIAGSNGDLAAKDRAVRLSHRLPQFQIAEIRFNVGKMYVQGTGVPRDLVAAYSWFALAQAAGDVRARDEQEKLEASMTREQVSEGLGRASDWLLAHRSAAGQHTRELAAIPQGSRSSR